jgi:putative addiction module component (TIGR02574 family)
MDMTSVMQAVESWPSDEQIEFIQSVWDRIVEAGWQPPLTEELKAELNRRNAALDANPNDVVSWDDVVAHVSRPR